MLRMGKIKKMINIRRRINVAFLAALWGTCLAAVRKAHLIPLQLVACILRQVVGDLGELPPELTRRGRVLGIALYTPREHMFNPLPGGHNLGFEKATRPAN